MTVRNNPGDRRDPVTRTTPDGTTILLSPSPLLWQLINDPRYGGHVYFGTMTEREKRAYGLGRLSVALNIETRARILEAIEGSSLIAPNKETVCDALRAVCRGLGLDDDALEWYDALIEYATLIGGGSGRDVHGADDVGLHRAPAPLTGTPRTVPEGTPIRYDDEHP